MTSHLDLQATVEWLGRVGYDAGGTARILALVAAHGQYVDRLVGVQADGPGWYLVWTLKRAR